MMNHFPPLFFHRQQLILYFCVQPAKKSFYMKMKIAIYDAAKKAGKFSGIQNKHGGNKTSNNGNRRHLRGKMGKLHSPRHD
jgi:hypothetical protein